MKIELNKGDFSIFCAWIKYMIDILFLSLTRKKSFQGRVSIPAPSYFLLLIVIFLDAFVELLSAIIEDNLYGPISGNLCIDKG